jgi:hypothetical protein
MSRLLGAHEPLMVITSEIAPVWMARDARSDFVRQFIGFSTLSGNLPALKPGFITPLQSN